MVHIVPNLLFAISVATRFFNILSTGELQRLHNIWQEGLESTAHLDNQHLGNNFIFSPIIYWVIMLLISSNLALHQHHRAGCWAPTLVYSQVKYFSSFHNSHRWKSHISHLFLPLIIGTGSGWFPLYTHTSRQNFICRLIGLKTIIIFLLSSMKREMRPFASFHWSQNIKFSLLEEKIRWNATFWGATCTFKFLVR